LVRFRNIAEEKGASMASAKILNDSDLVSFKELLMANSIQVDALAQLLIEKGLISKEEFFKKLKEVQSECDSRKAKG
jgi:hypothetical protein